MGKMWFICSERSERMDKRELRKKIKELERRKKEINKFLNNDKTILREFFLAMNNKKDPNMEKLYRKREEITKELIDLQLKYCDKIFKELGI